MISVMYSSGHKREELLRRDLPESAETDAVVREIIERVRREGDAALYSYALQFDKARLQSLEVSGEEMRAALENTDESFLETLKAAETNIRDFHARQKTEGFRVEKRGGVVLGQRVLPLRKVGVYVPGGTASYPSTVLMNVVPARIAGVEEIIVATPPSPDGSVRSEILAAAHIAGADRVFKIGGAGAVAALAYGTESVPAVDKVTGPGNVYVATAKRLVFGKVAIDMTAGPSEILIIADKSASPVFLAADLLSQAEHDRLSSAVLITDCEATALAVAAELERQLSGLPREDIARSSIERNGKIIVVRDTDEAIELANAYAPEHLELAVEDPLRLLPRVRSAGSVFLGHYTPEALGDYFAGPNHTLPTSGTARFSSPLGVDDFLRRSSYIFYSRAALEEVKDKVAGFALREGLAAHAESVKLRFRGEGGDGEK